MCVSSKSAELQSTFDTDRRDFHISIFSNLNLSVSVSLSSPALIPSSRHSTPRYRLMSAIMREDTTMSLTHFMHYTVCIMALWQKRDLSKSPNQPSGRDQICAPGFSDGISLIRVSPGAAGDSFLTPHTYVSPHLEHYLRHTHGHTHTHASPTLSMISAARGLSPADGENTVKLPRSERFGRCN
ncbi:hypothetical protein DNTS_018865 [Danionella cerebrum]|uniref:Uncharacterized protein n=1 Tax=Danionella cerebrum TaxID=2873325 RepID=A0A553QET3_9TELE|nr:hypothetical protein DNTS_018865 [Danionella translucida]TRY88430.1 hypothetical protein DNTS_018865 [Danionella translucida]